MWIYYESKHKIIAINLKKLANSKQPCGNLKALLWDKTTENSKITIAAEKIRLYLITKKSVTFLKSFINVGVNLNISKFTGSKNVDAHLIDIPLKSIL